MSFDMVKYERGQVWIIRFKNKEQVGHEQAKDRPWLILSIGKFNKSSGMLTAVPLTTRDYTTTPAQVQFVNDSGRNNVILCEQVRSFDYSSGNYVLDYLGTVSDEVLEKVDVAISIHLGLHYSPITLKSLYDSMEAIITSVGHMQDKSATPKFTNNDVEQFAKALAECAAGSFEIIPTSTPQVEYFDRSFSTVRVDEDYSTEEVDTGEDTLGKTIPFRMNEEPPVIKDMVSNAKKMKSPRIKWTPEVAQEFINDADTLPMKDVMSKWNILKKTRFYSMKNYAQGLLMKEN